MKNLRSKTLVKVNQAVTVSLEPLEDRRLLSGDFAWGGGDWGRHHGFDDGGFGGRADSSIAFSLTPAPVQTGLDKLATADGLANPAATASVHLNNVNGVETYSVTIDGTGTVSKLTVDQLGDAVTAPTKTTTTWAALSGTGTGSNVAAAAEITAIATALKLTAPASTDVVNVSTTSTGAVTYSIRLSNSTTTTTDSEWDGFFSTTVSVEAAGNPVGHQQLPFSVFSSTIQSGLNKAAPSGATALASSSTQNVDVQTTDGVTTYSTTFTASGTQTKVTVDATGKLTSLPTTTATIFSALSTTLQAELQTLATADGVTTAIAGTQSVTKLSETNGTIIYSVSLAKSGTFESGNTYTFDVTIAVDSNGNPTTLPHSGFGFGDQGFGRGFGGHRGGDWGSDDNSSSNSSSGSTSNSSTGSTTNASAGAVTLPNGGSATATSLIGSIINTYPLLGKLLSEATSNFGMLGGYLVEFATSKVDVAIITDVTSILATQRKLTTDTRGLTKVQKATLSADNKGMVSAIKALKTTLAPLEKTLKADAAANAALLKADLKVVAKNKKNPTGLATAKAKLATDTSAAFKAIAVDGLAIQTAIETSSGFVSAKAKLATDLPTIAADQSNIVAEQMQLVTDIEASLT